MDEALLVQLAREGREEALDELFTRVWPLVWHWAYGRALHPRGGCALDQAGDRTRQDGLRRAWHVLEQDVPATHERREDELDLVGLPMHHLLDIREQARRRSG
jgi:hypothetical protein